MSDSVSSHSVTPPGLLPAAPAYRLWALAGLMVLGIVVRFQGLATNPPWYTDELIYGEAARTLAEGDPRFGAVRWPFARECLAKPPLWFVVDAPLQWLPGPVMTKARLLSALVSLALVWVVFRIGEKLHSTEAGLVAGWVTLVHAPSLLYFRWATPYTLAGLLDALAVLFLAQDWTASRSTRRLTGASGLAGLDSSDLSNGLNGHNGADGAEGADRSDPTDRPDSAAAPHRQCEPRSSTRLLYWAAAMAGLAAVTDFFSLQTVAFVVVWTLGRRRWRALPGAIGLCVAPSLLFLVWGGSVRGGNFLREWGALILQFEGGGSLGATLRQLLRAAWITWTHDAVYLIGIPALAVWAWRGRGRVPALFLLFMVPLILRRQGFDPAAPHNLPSYVFAIELGFAVALCEMGRRVAGWVSNRSARGTRWGPASGIAVTVLLPTVMTVFAIVYVIRGIPTEEKALGSVRDVTVTREVCDWINARLDADDVAIVPDRLVVFLNCRAAPPNQALYAMGYDAVWMRYVNEEELAFRPTLDRARMVVIDAFQRLDGLRPEDPACTDPLAQKMREGQWRMAMQAGEYSVYLPPVNPSR